MDLVVREGELIAFVEVKARSEGPEGPLEAVSRAQKRRIRRAAEAWIHAHPGIGREFRFDVVGVRPRSDGTFDVDHVRGAWYGEEAL